MIIRPARLDDQRQIHDLIRVAFGQQSEARLVDDLTADGDVVLALVAEHDGVLLGQVVLSRLQSPDRALALAPLSVAPQARKRGIGTRLVREALEQARTLGEKIVFVLGEPGYYGRFGFTRAAALSYPCVYAGPYFMAHLLTDVPPVSAEVIYADAFGRL